MARVNLILCDLCGGSVSEADGGRHEITLTLNERDYSKDGAIVPVVTHGEICEGCYTGLVDKIKGEKVPVATAAAPPQVPVEKPAEPPVERKKTPRPSEPSEDLLDNEVGKIPSRLNRDKANRAIEKKLGKCPHTWKSYEDGKVICGAPPNSDKIKGELASHRGCGKVLSKEEY